MGEGIDIPFPDSSIAPEMKDAVGKKWQTILSQK